jgi:hypothetical protein
VRPRVDAIYAKANLTEGKKVTMSDATKDFLLSYYKDESAQLREMLRVEVPWANPWARSSRGEVRFPSIEEDKQ